MVTRIAVLKNKVWESNVWNLNFRIQTGRYQTVASRQSLPDSLPITKREFQQIWAILKLIMVARSWYYRDPNGKHRWRKSGSFYGFAQITLDLQGTSDSQCTLGQLTRSRSMTFYWIVLFDESFRLQIAGFTLKNLHRKPSWLSVSQTWNAISANLPNGIPQKTTGVWKHPILNFSSLALWFLLLLQPTSRVQILNVVKRPFLMRPGESGWGTSLTLTCPNSHSLLLFF